MSGFPWETTSQVNNRFAATSRVSQGPMSGRYTKNNPTLSPRTTTPYQITPQPPRARGHPDEAHNHPKGKREWETYQERTVPTVLPPRQTCREPIVAQPLSMAHSRLLPAGRSIALQIVDNHEQSQRMNVPRRKDQGSKMLRPDPTAPAPTLLMRLDGRGDLRNNIVKPPKTYVREPRYDPIRHRFNAKKEPFVAKHKDTKRNGMGRPDRLGEVHSIVPVFTHQVAKRENKEIVPDAARGTSVYSHLRNDGVNFLDFKEFHQNGCFLNQKAYSHSRHYNLGGHGIKNTMKEPGKSGPFVFL